jgi:DivIVA domain-containing protein
MTQGSGPGSTGAAGAGITPLDIQQKEFRVSRFGGYRMRDVDEFLDQLTEVVSGLVEENGRLRRQAGAAPVVGSPDLDDVARQADEIIQRARDEAARIAADARARSATGTPDVLTGEDQAAVKAFLQQERSFLQDLAGLVQEHAETVKGMARSARRQDASDAAPTEPPAAAATESPAGATTAPVDEAEVATGDEAGDEEEDEAGDEGPTERVVEIADADVTQTLPATDEPTELAPTRPSGAGQDRGAEGDASLRELFWGEDG